MGNLPGAAAPAVLGDLVTREITWTGSYRFVEEMEDALLALREGLDLTPLITHRFPVARAEEALAVAADPAGGSGKVMLRLSDGEARPSPRLGALPRVRRRPRAHLTAGTRGQVRGESSRPGRASSMPRSTASAIARVPASLGCSPSPLS
ncbi:hypothetical protein AB0H45_11650 [Streptomyces atroolivaceus]|uniref:hypothetical protein n=1 Tax=Streptomyces atroolivaceus TaxID=66869 RepID=UPI0033F3438F